MATETLGAHLRNLLTPYKTLLLLVEDINNGEIELDMLKKIKCDNIDEIIKFSYSDKMENNLWRGEKE
jgi:hypothetical protein